MKDGKATLDLSKDEKLVLPATVESLRSAILELMPHARLADVFLEVEDWTGFGDPGAWPQSPADHNGRVHRDPLSRDDPCL